MVMVFTVMGGTFSVAGLLLKMMNSPKNNITIKVDGGNLDEKKRETNLEPKRSRRDTYNKLGSLLLIIGVACGLIAAFFNYYEE